MKKSQVREQYKGEKTECTGLSGVKIKEIMKLNCPCLRTQKLEKDNYHIIITISLKLLNARF
jgi:hypothetical protein